MSTDFYSIPQQIILVLCSSISGSLSLLGSSIILWIIWRDRNVKLRHIYHRILFVISIIDCVTSINFIFSFLAVPEGLFWGARGNISTCETSGFIISFLSSLSFYNAGLASYYFLIIVRSSPQAFLSRTLEPLTHVLSLLLPFLFCTWILINDAYNPLLYNGGWCSVYEFPQGCSSQDSDIKCTRGEMAKQLATIFMLCLNLPPFLVFIIAMICIIYYSKKQTMIVSRWRISSRFDHFHETIKQALLYITSFMLPYSIVLVAAFISTEQSTSRFVLACFVKLILPLPGLFNVIIYIRPRYILLRLDRGERASSYSLLQEIIIGRRSTESTIEVDDDFAPELTLDISAQRESQFHEELENAAVDDHHDEN
jgi:hypothetical protein